MGATEKYSRYRWKEGRERDLWSFVDGKVRDGASVTSALKEYGKKHNMSWLTARWKYYQIRKQGMAAERPARSAPAEGQPVGLFTPDEEDFLGYLSEFVSSSREYGQDIVPFIKGLSRMAALSKEASKLREERDRRATEAGAHAGAIADACAFLRDWLSLSQVDRVASLKAFSENLGSLVERLDEVRECLSGAV